MEMKFEVNPSGTNRAKIHKVQVELRKQLVKEQEFQKWKAGMEWFKDGERNTKLFHIMARGKRARQKVKRIQDDRGNWLENQKNIASVFDEFYEKQFTKQTDYEDYSMLDELSYKVTETMNDELQKVPTMEEVKEVVMGQWDDRRVFSRGLGYYQGRCI